MTAWTPFGVALAVLAVIALAAGAPLALPPILAAGGFAAVAIGHRRILERRDEEQRRRERLIDAAWKRASSPSASPDEEAYEARHRGRFPE